MNLRKLLQEFFEVHEAAWEIFMIVLAIAFVAIGFLPDLIDFSDDSLNLLDNIDLGVTLFFALEFTTRISIATSKKTYLKEHWLDLVAILPVVRWLRVARLARIIRLFRLVRLIRVLNSMRRLEMDLARFGKLNGLQWMMLALVIVMLSTSVLLYMFESPVNEKLTSYWDALYASLITWSTPGYGDILPVTTNGRICGLILIISGLIAWGLFIANLAAFLATRRSENPSDSTTLELQEKLSRIDQLNRDELVSLRGAVTALIDDRINGSD